MNGARKKMGAHYPHGRAKGNAVGKRPAMPYLTVKDAAKPSRVGGTVISSGSKLPLEKDFA